MFACHNKRGKNDVKQNKSLSAAAGARAGRSLSGIPGGEKFCLPPQLKIHSNFDKT
jgi:hypothetical protein